MMRRFIAGLLYALSFATVAAGCNASRKANSPLSPAQSQQQQSVRIRDLPVGWHWTADNNLPFAIALKSSWTLEDRLSTGTESLPYVYLDDAQGDSIDIQRDNSLPFDDTTEDLLRDADLLDASATTIGGQPGIEGYGASPALSTTPDFTKKRIEVFAPSGQLYLILIRCPSAPRDCDEIVGHLQFR